MDIIMVISVIALNIGIVVGILFYVVFRLWKYEHMLNTFNKLMVKKIAGNITPLELAWAKHTAYLPDFQDHPRAKAMRAYNDYINRYKKIQKPLVTKVEIKRSDPLHAPYDWSVIHNLQSDLYGAADKVKFVNISS